MPIIYVVQDPDGKEIAVAREYGQLCVMLNGRETTGLAIEKLTSHLQSITRDDFLLQIGSPLNIGIATHLALLFNEGELNLLVWHRQTYKYNIEHITTYESTKSPNAAATHGR